MTFKHADSRESSVYRALEKIAYEKGLVKPETINKTASKKVIDLAAGPNLMENILKLCSALREEGLDRQASELERNLMICKAASKGTPEVDPETIQQAHPKGSVRVSNLDGDAVVEDILDQHLEILNVALKPAKGRISTASEVIKQVKIVLAEESSQELVGEALALLKRIEDVAASDADAGSFAVPIATVRAYLNMRPLTLDAIKSASASIASMKSQMEPGWLTENARSLSAALSQDAWRRVSETEFPRLESIMIKLNSIRESELNIENLARQENIRNKNFNAPSGPNETSLSNKDYLTLAPPVKITKLPKNTDTPGPDRDLFQFIDESDRAIKRLEKWDGDITATPENNLDSEDKNNAKRWISSKKNKIDALVKQFNAIDDNNRRKSFAAKYLAALRALTWKSPNDFETFRRNFGLTNDY